MRLKLIALLLIVGLFGYSQVPVLDKIKVYANSNTTVPAVIFQSNTNGGLPLVIFSHGNGEQGTTGAALWNAGLPAALKSGFKPPFACVIIAPQRSSYSVAPDWLPNIIADAIARFKIDTNRIYLTGLSAGGWATYGSQLNLTPAFAKKIAAIVPLSAATQDLIKSNFAQYNAPTWAIVGGNDISYKEQNEDMVKRINAVKPGLAKLNIRTGVGHGGWTEIYNGTWKGTDGKSIWDWMYQFKRGTTTPPIVVPPVQTPIYAQNYLDSIIKTYTAQLASKDAQIKTLNESVQNLNTQLTTLTISFNLMKTDYERILGILNNIILQICNK